MEVEMVSRENIKPSSPTPPHLRTHKLSILDLTMPTLFAPLVLYLPAATGKFISQTTQILKQSLSQTLTHFYPLAGRLAPDRLSVDCNDEGILFAVSRIKCNLSEFLKNPDAAECCRHLPEQLCWAEPDPGTHARVAMIQVNYFNCGGIAIGSLFLHTVTDGTTVAMFLKAWAANTHQGNFPITEWPDYTARSLFPDNRAIEREQGLSIIMAQHYRFGKTCLKRYVFDSSTISTLRDKLQEASSPRLSKVEIVTAFLWKCFILALSDKSDKTQINSLVTQFINLRRRSNPLFPDHTFGNFLWMAPGSASTVHQTDDVDLKELICKLRSSVSKIDYGFIARMQGDEGFSGYLRNYADTMSQIPEKAELLNITSWCNFGIYDIDFGWGKPLWVSRCDATSDGDGPFMNVLWLMDTGHGDGVEAWLNVDQRYIAAFDQNLELQALASVDPSPLDGVAQRQSKDFQAEADQSKKNYLGRSKL